MAKFTRIDTDKPEGTKSLEELVTQGDNAAKNELLRRANNKLAKKSA